MLFSIAIILIFLGVITIIFGGTILPGKSGIIERLFSLRTKRYGRFTIPLMGIAFIYAAVMIILHH